MSSSVRNGAEGRAGGDGEQARGEVEHRRTTNRLLAGREQERPGGRRQHGQQLGRPLDLAQVRPGRTRRQTVKNSTVTMPPATPSGGVGVDLAERPHHRERGQGGGIRSRAAASSRPSGTRPASHPVDRLAASPTSGETVVIVRNTPRSNPRSARIDWLNSDTPGGTSR